MKELLWLYKEVTLKIALPAAVIFFILFLFFGCAREEGGPKVGCVTGISKSTGELELVRCCTYEEYAAGSNTSAGGIAYWSNYTAHKWEDAKNCEECQNKYW